MKKVPAEGHDDFLRNTVVNNISYHAVNHIRPTQLLSSLFGPNFDRRFRDAKESQCSPDHLGIIGLAENRKSRKRNREPSTHATSQSSHKTEKSSAKLGGLRESTISPVYLGKDE